MGKLTQKTGSKARSRSTDSVSDSESSNAASEDRDYSSDHRKVDSSTSSVKNVKRFESNSASKLPYEDKIASSEENESVEESGGSEVSESENEESESGEASEASEESENIEENVESEESENIENSKSEGSSSESESSASQGESDSESNIRMSKKAVVESENSDDQNSEESSEDSEPTTPEKRGKRKVINSQDSSVKSSESEDYSLGSDENEYSSDSVSSDLSRSSMSYEGSPSLQSSNGANIKSIEVSSLSSSDLKLKPEASRKKGLAAVIISNEDMDVLNFGSPTTSNRHVKGSPSKVLDIDPDAAFQIYATLNPMESIYPVKVSILSSPTNVKHLFRIRPVAKCMKIYDDLMQLLKSLPQQRAILSAIASKTIVSGKNSLLEAVSDGDTLSVVALLLDDRDPDEPSNKGVTPLMTAADRSFGIILQILLIAEANINAQDSRGWSALFYAANRGDGDVVQLLISRNADFRIKDKSNLLASSFARTVEARMIFDRIVSYNIPTSTIASLRMINASDLESSKFKMHKTFSDRNVLSQSRNDSPDSDSKNSSMMSSSEYSDDASVNIDDKLQDGEFSSPSSYSPPHSAIDYTAAKSGESLLVPPRRRGLDRLGKSKWDTESSSCDNQESDLTVSEGVEIEKDSALAINELSYISSTVFNSENMNIPSNSIVSEIISDIQLKYYFTRKELERAFFEFCWFCSGRLPKIEVNDDISKLFLTKNSFREVYSDLTGIKSFFLSDLVFGAFDIGKSGKISFKNYIETIALCCRGSREAKVKFSFSVYDQDDSGEITREEWMEVLNEVALVTNDVGYLDDGELLYDLTDVDSSGAISFDEFYSNFVPFLMVLQPISPVRVSGLRYSNAPGGKPPLSEIERSQKMLRKLKNHKSRAYRSRNFDGED